MALADFSGTDPGKRRVEYDERDVMLYALAVGHIDGDAARGRAARSDPARALHAGNRGP